MRPRRKSDAVSCTGPTNVTPDGHAHVRHRPPHDEINQRLVDQYTEIARLAGGLAHEIKNPLSTIRLNMELLAEDFRDSDSPRDRRALQKIQLVERECQRLQDLLDNFLNFAKARRLNLEPSDLNAQVRQVLDFFRPKAPEAADRDRRLPGRRPAHGALGPRSFHGALLNLVLNAEQAMPRAGNWWSAPTARPTAWPWT